LADLAKRTGKRPATRDVTDRNFDGVNVVGHFTDTSGLAEATRSTARCLEAVGIPISTLDVGPTSPLAEGFEPNWTDHTASYDVTVVHDNVAHAADESQHYLKRSSCHTVGFWYWELEDLPNSFAPAFDLVDEVWTPSRFVRDALQPKTDKPVTVVPPSVDLRTPGGDLRTPVGVDRAVFGLPEDRFLFLTMASVYSVLERKNPLAVVKAFEMAFDANDRVGLVVKITDLQHRPDVAEALRDAAARAPVFLLEERLSRHGIHKLLASVDSYVSLHRSEGFGLPVAEAMALGKPAIATGYSGSADFATDETSFLVPYELVAIERTYTVYPAGFHWADPNLDVAAAHMRTVAFDEAASSRVAAAGQAFVRAYCDPSVGGEVIRDRLRAVAGSTAPPR
jgi:glycosyltransferase involved in cell wall biosynthesis